MPDLVRILPKRDVLTLDSDPHLREEWLVTNGLGGYASGTVTGAITRRYHGLLIAALPNPLGRMMMLNGLGERLRLPDRRIVYLSAAGLPEASPQSTLPAAQFRLEAGLPAWRYKTSIFTLEKRLLMTHGQNTVYINYRVLVGKAALRLGLRPAIDFRPHDAPVSSVSAPQYKLTVLDDRFEISGRPELPVLRMWLEGPLNAFTFGRKGIVRVHYAAEQSRGYESQGSLWSPGYFHVDLREGQQATLIASTETWETIHALTPELATQSEIERRRQLVSMANPRARHGVAAELVLAADQFLIMPVGRTDEVTRTLAAGEEARTVIAGYHWFTDWGRDTMISLEGLTLITGRQQEARWILHTFSRYLRDGLIANMFPEGAKEGLYHTADASLWYFHALHRYVTCTGDRITLEAILPKLVEIVDKLVHGTCFGIVMDPADGLLRQGQHGYQLTWMDAKVNDWVVTPRRGKAVEINALWYNALRLLSQWLSEEKGEHAAREVREIADRAYESFNRRFWYKDGGYLYDVIDGENGDDPACRPNQVLAISLNSSGAGLSLLATGHGCRH